MLIRHSILVLTLAISGKPGTKHTAPTSAGEPGPLFLQGDHGPVEYRNIVITPAR